MELIVYQGKKTDCKHNMPPLIFICKLAQLSTFSVLVYDKTSELPLTPPSFSGPISNSISYFLLILFPSHHHHSLGFISHLENFGGFSVGFFCL